MANYPQVNATTYAAIVAANPSFKAILWSQKVLMGASQRSLFKGLIGGEGSKMPVIRKRDLTKGNAQQVEFTTIAPVRGQGVLGENSLTGNERALNFGSFNVTVDLLRHAVSYTQVLGLLRKLGKTLPQLSSDLMTEWWARKNDDDIQTTLRNRALLVSPATNLVRVNQRSSRGELLSSDTMTTTAVEMTKAALAGNGGMAIEESAEGGKTSHVEKYLLVAPDLFLKPMRATSSFQAVLQNAGVRGGNNELFSGHYPIWDGNILNNHIIKEDAADGRQGSPLQPYARLGTALSGAGTTTITGGGTTYPAGTGDYFAYFPGFSWKIYDSEVLPTDSATHYAMIYNVTGADAGKYEIFSYTSAGVSSSGHQITGVTRGTNANFAGNVTANAASRFTNDHPSGSIILPCTENGVILGWGLHMGAEALFHAIGEKDAQPISNKQDYENDAGEAHLVGGGIQGVRGMSPFVDKRSVAPNFVLVEGTYVFPGVNPEPYLG